VAFSFNAFSYEGEIVVNKKGQPVLLKNDNTWEILNPSGLHNKVVFTIIDSFNKIYIWPVKDEWGEPKEHGFLYIIKHLVTQGYNVDALPIATNLDLISLNSLEDLSDYL
tara:strand:+ start:174 stop:503 length:330 start_codon:yes stop_codon:yes gene_type:complete